MKLRLDLLKHLKAEDLMEDIGFDIHRWSAEPVFAKTGVGFLKPATEADKVAEAAHFAKITEKVLARAAEDRESRAEASLDSRQSS
jgi:hypothetical protein